MALVRWACGKLAVVQRQTFDLPGGEFHALVAGDGPPVIYLHGFPDHPPTCAAFLDELAARGRRVIAPWLRGYSPSPTAGPFDRATLVGDIAALIDSVGAPLDIIGHDWGAVITYALCAAHPELVRRAVTMAVPHPRTFLKQARQRPRQLAASWYMGFFQIPGSERIVAARHFALIDRLWRKWSPSLTVSAEQRASLRDCLAASWPAPLEYYRDMRRNAKRDLPALRAPIEVPLLYLHGANDGCVLPPTIDDSDRFANEYEREVIEGLGHFMHVEDPSGLCDRIDEWFDQIQLLEIAGD